MDSQTKRDVKIYQTYLYLARAERSDKNAMVMRMCADFGVSRGTLYQAIRRIRDGNQAKIQKAMEDARLDVMWRYKYQPRYASLLKDRRPDTIRELRDIIRDMDANGFPQALAARLLGKDRSTIIHHLNS